MAERKTGLAPLPTGLLRPTTPPEPAELTEEPTAEEGRGDAAAESRPARARRKRPPVNGEKTRGRKLHLPDEIHDRLWLLARQKRTTVSAVATELLDKNLPRWRVEREG
jgi:hypothetical protein